jgi:putative pyoverdin transport system ATP-binding/permease protein
MRVYRLIRGELRQHLGMLAVMTVAGAMSITALLWLVNEVAADAAQGRVSLSAALRFGAIIVLFAASQNYVLVTASQDVEELLHRIRIRLFDRLRQADLMTVESIGRAALSNALIQDTQVLAQNVPMLLIGAQQAAMLVFLALYLAWLSPVACLLAFGFAALVLAIRFSRMVALGKAMQAASEAGLEVFDGLTDMLRGFKEVRMSRRRADDLLAGLRATSGKARLVNSDTKRQWGREFALLQTMFYALIGLMVFVVPSFASGYSEVVVEATVVTLFIVGPVGTLAYVTPLASQTDFALASIDAIEQRLIASSQGPDESAWPLDAPPASIALEDATFSYRAADGTPLFTVGPLSAEFRSGEIAFITGGNGSGKSTLLRLLTGLVPLASGRLLADGLPVAPEQMQDYRDQISAIFSDNYLSRRLYGISGPAVARADALLARLEMSGKAAVRNGAFSTVDLSAGQRKRLALVVALLEDKPVIVLDEWAAGQDPHFRRVFYETLLPEWKQQGKIVICVTHDDRWFGAAGQVLRMDEGLFSSGQPLEIGGSREKK